MVFEWRKKKSSEEFTSFLRWGRMTLKCTRTDRKVQLLVLVFSWSCTETRKSIQPAEPFHSYYSINFPFLGGGLFLGLSPLFNSDSSEIKEGWRENGFHLIKSPGCINTGHTLHQVFSIFEQISVQSENSPCWSSSKSCPCVADSRRGSESSSTRSDTWLRPGYCRTQLQTHGSAKWPQTPAHTRTTKAHTNAVVFWVIMSRVIASWTALPLWVWAATAAAFATLGFWHDVAGSCYSNALLTLKCHYPAQIGPGGWRKIMENGVQCC